MVCKCGHRKESHSNILGWCGECYQTAGFADYKHEYREQKENN
jgi:hypothetical protein